VKENLLQFHFIHYEFYKGWHGTEPQAFAVRNQHVTTWCTTKHATLILIQNSLLFSVKRSLHTP
jgi:hypothetical protein